MSDIRKWFMKQHDKGATPAASKPAAPADSKPAAPAASRPAAPPPEKPKPSPEKQVQEAPGSSARRKTSKFFANSAPAGASTAQVKKESGSAEKTPAKRKAPKGSEDIFDDVKPTPAKKFHKEEEDDDDFMPSSGKKKSVEAKPSKKLKSESGAIVTKKSLDMDEDYEDDEKEAKTAVKSGGRGRGGRGSGTAARGRGRGGGGGNDDGEDDEKEATAVKSGGRGRGGRGAGAGIAAAAVGRGRGGSGRGGFMSFGERKDPPHKGEKEVPEGASDCLNGLTFVISGTLDSLEREEAEDLIKRHGGRVTGSISKKTSFLLADEDIGGRKSEKAKELGTPFLTEDGLFDMIRKSKPAQSSVRGSPKKQILEKGDKAQIRSSPLKVEAKGIEVSPLSTKGSVRSVQSSAALNKKKTQSCGGQNSLPWTEKYRPKVPDDIIGNQSLVKQLREWLMHWNEHFLHADKKVKGKKQSDSGANKAVLLSGTPGIGKTTSAKLVSQMLGYQVVEVNASDTRGKADSKIVKGIGGNKSNAIKVLVNNESLGGKNWSKYPKSVLIMDEVDGMSAGDRGGVADLIASIKISKLPIICICNDRYSQKLKSLVNYCLALNFRKPTKQQMAKRLMQIAVAEGIQVNELALEELADRVNGDMRMALNQLQYMSLSQSVIKYDDVRERLLSSSKDEDISPFTAVEKLLGFNGGKLRMDQRIDLSMSDPDLVPLIIQENYLNYRPSSIGKDDSGVKRMNQIARAAESIADGDIINVQIRRYRQWQLSQAGSFASSIFPAALMHGNREILEQGERNYNRFGGWLGKNSTMGKNMRLLEDTHMHILSSQESNLDRVTLRLDYFSHLLKHLTIPLKSMPKDVAVSKVVEFMDTYSLSQEDFDTIVELSKFKGHPNPMEGIESAVKAALTKAYKQGSSSRVVRVADMITLPGVKKAPKKRIAAMLEPVESGLPEENGEAMVESEDENSDSEDTDDGERKPKLDLLNDKPKGVHVELNLKSSEKSSTKKTPASKARGSDAEKSSTKKTPASKARGSDAAGSGTRGGKRKR